ncbi:hypothetical protein AB0B79_26330 [Streptomyces sp. NPDC039022]
MDDEALWATARRLLHDDTLKPEDRLAGVLLLLYAQWPAAISRLTVDHIEETDGAVRIRLGAVPDDLPGPVAELALHQGAVRRSHAVLARTESPWLFPGGEQPGRPISVWAMGGTTSATGASRRPTVTTPRDRCQSPIRLASVGPLTTALARRTPAPCSSGGRRGCTNLGGRPGPHLVQ